MTPAEEVWERLMLHKDNDDPITPLEEAMLRKDAGDKLDEGWTVPEVVAVLRWTEYFCTKSSESLCLARMAEGKSRALARIAAVASTPDRGR